MAAVAAQNIVWARCRWVPAGPKMRSKSASHRFRASVERFTAPVKLKWTTQQPQLHRADVDTITKTPREQDRVLWGTSTVIRMRYRLFNLPSL